MPPILAETLLALGVAVGAVLADALGHDSHRVAALLWDMALAAPLVLRRRAPATATALIGTTCFAQWLTGTTADGDLAVLIMLYSLGAWERRRLLMIAAVVVAEAGAVMALLRWAPASQRGLSGILLSTGTVTAAWAIGLYMRIRRAYLASMLERAESAERDRDRLAQIAVAEERSQMAREMHDIIAHSLAVMITLNDAAVAVSAPGPARDAATQASEVGRQALADMQRMLGVLRSTEPAEVTPQPGTAQLADLIATVRSAGLSVELAISGDPTELAPTTQLAIYRIVQESLTNILKHARDVTRVAATITYRDGRVRVQVTNDGERAQQKDAIPGHGLVGMRERSALYGGQFTAGPLNGGGWQVLADLRVTDPAVVS